VSGKLHQALGNASLPKWRLWFDDQCEVCQAGVTWLRRLDRHGRVDAIPLSKDAAAERAPPSHVPAEALLKHLHVVTPDGELLRGAAAVAGLARLFPITWLFGFVASLPGFSLLATVLYDWIASNRYSLSRCRGGACQTARVDILEKKAGHAFRLCHALGWTAVAPLSLVIYVGRIARQYQLWRATRKRVVHLLNGRLSIFFLSGGLSWLVGVLFGELFTAVQYEALLVDPGGSRMKTSILRHLRSQRKKPSVAVATHAHEEHCGNLEAVARAEDIRNLATASAISALKDLPLLPFMRRLVIGQPERISRIDILPSCLRLQNETEVVVVPTPGHCAEHVSLFIPSEKLLIAGDAFMGTHFLSPNDDVDHHAWITTLESLSRLDIEVMVEAHGHVHTLRTDVLGELEKSGLGLIASRRSPRELIQSKLEFVQWINEQIILGEHEGLSPHGLQATVFPWTQRWSYETWIQDSFAALLSGREFGRHKVVRSFRPPQPGVSALPLVFELRWMNNTPGNVEVPSSSLSAGSSPPTVPEKHS